EYRRQPPVQQHQARLPISHGNAPLLGIASLGNAEPGTLQRKAYHAANRRFVLDDQDMLFGHALVTVGSRSQLMTARLHEHDSRHLLVTRVSSRPQRQATEWG